MLGSTLAVYIVGSIGAVQGSLLATAVGAAVPTVALAVNADDAYMPLFGALFVAPLQASAATLGFYLTRRRQGSERATQR
ncbi:MAG: hypothetical protein M3282_06015 [Gemmatimonadota bacterium]|nr:hypothetical protein [Gemmatimonadota bacterium]